MENGLSHSSSAPANGGAESSSDSRDISRASSVERDDSSNHSSFLHGTNRRTHTNSENEAEDDAGSSSRRKLSKRTANIATNKKLTAAVKRLNEEDEDMPSETVPASGENSLDFDGSNSSRPVRTVVANAAAISEAQSGLNGKKRKGRPRKGVPIPVDFEKNDKVVDAIVGLDSLHETTLNQIAGMLIAN